MTKFHETEAAAGFIATAASRETSPEIMKAIAYHARSLKEAEAIWNGDGIASTREGIMAIWETATGNGLSDAHTLHWGADTLGAIVARLD